MSTDRKIVGRVIVSEEEIKKVVADLGKQISKDYKGKDVLLVGVLKGAFIFMADLVREIDLDCEVDFMAVSSYGASTKSSGVVRIIKDLDVDLTGKHVIIVEDIIDSGLTLTYLRKNLQARGPESLEVCAMFVKEDRIQTNQRVKYKGFGLDPEFVIGYGLDLAEKYRGLPYLSIIGEGQ